LKIEKRWGTEAFWQRATSQRAARLVVMAMGNGQERRRRHIIQKAVV
jgi:hypothetical protein